jgi:AcrR family transcriptional regulator
MARLSRSESQALTRTALMEAARAVFVEFGVNAASVDLIAERAGYSKGAFYSNFASKEKILAALLEQHMEYEVRELLNLLDHDSTQEELWSCLREHYRKKAANASFCILSVEFQLLAIRNPEMREHYISLWRVHLADLTRILEKACERMNMQLTSPAADIISSLAALGHGVILQGQIGRHKDAIPVEDLMVNFLQRELQCPLGNR